MRKTFVHEIWSHKYMMQALHGHAHAKIWLFTKQYTRIQGKGQEYG